MGTLDAALQAAGPSSDATPQGTLGAALQAATAPSGVGNRKFTPVEMPEAPPSLLNRLGGAGLDLAGGAGETVASGVLNTAGSLAGGAAGWTGNALKDPQTAQKWADATQKAVSTVGGLYNGPETTTGKLAQSGLNWVGQKVGNAADAVGDWVLGKTNDPVLASLANAAVQTVPMVLAGKAIAKPVGAVAERLAGDVDGGVSASSAAQPLSREMVGGGAASASANPYPTLTGEDPNGLLKFSRVAEDIPEPEQALRAQIMRKVMELPDDGPVRPGVRTGNPDTLATESLEANAANPDPRGVLLKQQIADEQQGFANYAEKQLDATGANPRFTKDGERGDFLNQVMYGQPDEDGLPQGGIKGALDAAKKNIYDQAKAATGNNPVQMPALTQLLQDPQFQAELKLNGQKDFTGGLADLLQTHQTTGFEGSAPNTIAGAEALRQSLNRSWTPQNKYFIGRAVSAIDDDVAAAGGPGLYQQGRAIHAAEKQMFGSPGIKTLFGDADPNGVKAGTPVEQIPDKLNSMPFDQWRHVYDTYDAVSQGRLPGGVQVSPELQQAAQQAKSEMAGSLVREVRDTGIKTIGNWNARGVNNAVMGLEPKLSYALDPETMGNLHALRLAGNMAPPRFSYEGAALQMRRAGEADVGVIEKHLPKALTAAGAGASHAIGIPGGELLGLKLGEKGSALLTQGRKLNAARKLDQEMRK